MRNDIKQAFDARMSGMRLSQARRDAILRAAFDKERTPGMKKKLPLGLAMALILLIVTAVTVAATTNLFGLFTRQDPAMQYVAQHALPVETAKAGAPGRIDSAYFDGNTLYLAFSTPSAAASLESWTPEEAIMRELDRPVMIEDPVFGFDSLRNALDAHAPDKYRAVKEKHDHGEPYGFWFSLWTPSDHFKAGGWDVPWTEMGQTDTGGGFIAWYVRFETPLPDKIAREEELSLSLTLYQQHCYVYFDGSRTYARAFPQEGRETVTAMVKKAASSSAALKGRASFRGAEIQAEAWAAPTEIRVTVRHGLDNSPRHFSYVDPETGRDFSETREPFDFVLLDERTGAMIQPAQTEQEGQTMRLVFRGLGYLPDSLALVPQEAVTPYQDEAGSWHNEAQYPEDAVRLK